MPLENLVSLRQADAVAVFLGGEIKFKDFVLHIPRDSGAAVADLSDNGVLFAAGRDGELASLGHSLNAVENHVEQSLFHQIEVGLYGQRLFGPIVNDDDAVLLAVGSGEQSDIFEKAAKIDFDQMQFACAHEVDQGLHAAVEAVNFAADDIHVAARIGIELRELVLQKLQVKNNRINRILDFVGDAAGNASAGGETTGHFDFVADTLHGFGVAHDEQSADLRALFLNEVHGDLHATACSGGEFALRERTPALEGVEYHGSELRVASENFAGGAAKKFGARAAEKTLDGSADQHYAGVAGEQHQSILQFGHELIDVVFQGGKDFPAVADLA